jgi:hypothetical protein
VGESPVPPVMIRASTFGFDNASLVVLRIIGLESEISLRPMTECPSFLVSCSIVSPDSSLGCCFDCNCSNLDVLHVTMYTPTDLGDDCLCSFETWLMSYRFTFLVTRSFRI